MAEIITGDNTKGIKNVGELALRISRFDSYRLFTLYENVKERKLMDVSGNQKYYLVFRFPKKEIRIPEYDPKGFFEVDKVNGCVLFKITKKNADDILSAKNGGNKIFHIVRVFEEIDSFGRVLNVTDEVEVYNGRWGDDNDFHTFSTENKVDLLTKALAAQIDKNSKLLQEYEDLLKEFDKQVEITSNQEKEIDQLNVKLDELQDQLNAYDGTVHEGTILSTDTKYVAFEGAEGNVQFTEEHYKAAMTELLEKGSVELSEIGAYNCDIDLEVYSAVKGVEINIFKNSKNLGVVPYNDNNEENKFNKTFSINADDLFIFNLVINKDELSKEVGRINFNFKPDDDYKDKYKGFVKLEPSSTSGVMGVNFNNPSTKEYKASIVLLDKDGNVVDISTLEVDIIGTLKFCVY